MQFADCISKLQESDLLILSIYTHKESVIISWLDV